jgi:Uri superfamily endonuclease
LKGIYVLIIQIDKAIDVEIGALGKLMFPTGLYAYVGSAQNNLELRVKRHMGKEKHLFWHIDYLLNNPSAKVTSVYYTEGGKVKECKTARLLQKNGVAVSGFGCSDCHCKSHLFHVQEITFLKWYVKPLTVEVIATELVRSVSILKVAFGEGLSSANIGK